MNTLLELASKIKSLEISSAKFDRVSKLLITAWSVALLIVWFITSLHKHEVADIPWSILALVAILLGANIGLNFGGTDSPVTPPPSNPANPIPPPVIPELSNQPPKGEKD